MKAGLKRKTGTLVQGILVAILLLYAADWSAFHIRTQHGPAFGQVRVAQYLTTPLKGNKAEFDYMGTVTQTCSRSIFPQAGDSPCWWLNRHKTQWQQ